METWRKRATWLLKDSQSFSKSTRLLLREILDFFNGDSQSQTVVHWCLRNNGSGKPCCASDAESLNKAITLLTSFFAKGFAVPLLYRMKHYGPAAAFVRLGCCLHKILPRVLLVDQKLLTQADGVGNELSNLVDTLLADNKPQSSSQAGSLNDADFQMLLAKLLDQDSNYAAQNGARCKLVQKEISHPMFHQSSIIIDALVQRMESGVNFFLRRTKVLYDLQFQSQAHPEYEKLQQESKDRFLFVIRGDLGQKLVSSYLDLLNNGFKEALEMGLEGTQDQLNTIFQMVVNCVADLHRRMVHEFQVPPFTLLRLAEVEPVEFVSAWRKLRNKFLRCDSCLDVEFSTAILSKYAFDFSIPPTDSDLATIKEIQEVLVDTCVWSPLTSDAVEILNGQVQWALSRRGSQYLKQGRAAVETSLLGAAIKQHSWCRQAAQSETFPEKATASGIRRSSGTKSSNQHTVRDMDVGLVSSAMS